MSDATLEGGASRIARAAALIMLGSVASRLLGLGRDQVIAAFFGATAITSAFVVAQTVPLMVYDLLIGGAIGAALIPVFSDYATDERELGRVGSAVLTLTGFSLATATLILVLLAPQLVALLGGGFGPDTQAQALTLVRIALPSVVFLGLAGVTTSLLYARQIFTYPAFGPAVYNASVILTVLALSGTLGAASLVLGLVAGGVVQLALHTPGLRGIPLRPSLTLSHAGVQRILQLYAPVALGLVVTQMGVALDRNLASRTGEDSIAVMRFATTLIQLPLGLVVTAISFAVLPALSRFASRIEWAAEAPVPNPGGPSVPAAASQGLRAYKETLALGLRMALLAILPMTVGLMVLRVPLIRVLFEHGRFDARATARTALAFLLYAPQLPFVAADQLLIFAFYARKDTLTPMLVGVMGVGVYLAVGLSLIGAWGMYGLVIANTLQNASHGVVMFLLLRRVIGDLGATVRTASLKMLLATAVMALVLYLAGPALAGITGPALRGQILFLALAVALGAGIYGAAVVALRIEEAGLMWRLLRQRLA